MLHRRNNRIAAVSAADELEDIRQEMIDLLDRAKSVVQSAGYSSSVYNRAKSYWIGHIAMALSKESEYLGSNMSTMEDTVMELRGLENPEDEDEYGDVDPDDSDLPPTRTKYDASFRGGRLTRRAAAAIPSHLKGYIVMHLKPEDRASDYKMPELNWNPTRLPDEVMQVTVAAAQSAYDADVEMAKEYGEPLKPTPYAPVFVMSQVEYTNREWYADTDEYGYRGNYYRTLPEHTASRKWIVTDNAERGGGSLIFNEDTATWYYREHYSEGPDHLIKGGLPEALANADLMFHG